MADCSLYLTTADAARDAGLTPAGIRAAVRRGSLAVARMTRSGQKLFDPREVQRYAKARRKR